MSSDLSRAVASYSYEGVEFPGSDSKVSWGHDSAKHQGYLQRGAVVEPTGQKPRVFTVRVPLRNGLRWTGPERLWPETYVALREKLKTAEGFLTHPTYGLVTVIVDDVQETIDPTRGDGVDLDLTFTEQDGQSQELELTGPSAASPAEGARQWAEEADAAAQELEVADATSLADEVSESFEYLEEAERSYSDAIGCVAELTASIRARALDVAAADADGHDYRYALARTLAAVIAYRDDYLGVEAPVVLELPEAMGIARAASLAYGDPTRGAELAARNRLPDPSMIPAGTRLVL